MKSGGFCAPVVSIWLKSRCGHAGCFALCARMQYAIHADDAALNRKCL